MTYKEYLQEFDVYDETYTWIPDDTLKDKRCIYVWEFVLVTTSVLYELLHDPESKESVAENIRVVDYSKIDYTSIPNLIVREHVKEVLLLETEIGHEYEQYHI